MSFAFQLGEIESQRYFRSLNGAITQLRSVLEDNVTNWFNSAWEANRVAHGFETDISAHFEHFQGVIDTDIEEIQKVYSFLQNQDTQEQWENNRWLHDQEDFDNSSGMPHHTQLGLLMAQQRNPPRVSSLSDQRRKLRALMESDDVPLLQVHNTAEGIRKNALKYRFVEMLEERPLPDIMNNHISQVRYLGLLDETKELWMVSYQGMDRLTSMPSVHTVLLSQDLGAEYLYVSQNGFHPDKRLSFDSLAYANDTWYLINRIDNGFQELHPLAVGRLLIGPFDSPYISRDEPNAQRLKVFEEVAQEDPNVRFMRATMMMSFAPDTKIVQTEQGPAYRQDVPKNESGVEIILTPGRHTNKLVDRIGGANVHIYEYREEAV